MEIMFLCSSLEPGKDGVGDYARKLVAGLIKNNHKVSIVSCNERYISADLEEVQHESGIEIIVYRLSAKNTWKHRFEKVQVYLDAFKPQWISLHYVPYAFHPKGLPVKFVYGMQSLYFSAKVHIMFHEIWQGESSESTLKDKIIGFVQRHIAFRLIKVTKAIHVTTTNDYYKNCFVKRGIKATHIPVFSNMPVGNALGRAVADTISDEVKNNRSRYILGVFFGGFHAHAGLADNLKILADKIKKELNKELVISHIGRSGGIAEQFEEVKALTGLKGFVLGEWQEQDVADYLLYADIGLSNYPKVLFEKSGSIAALLNNCCSVVLLKDSFEPDNRVLPEIKEFNEAFSFDAFLNQDKAFASKYGVAGSCKEYDELFS